MFHIIFKWTCIYFTVFVKIKTITMLFVLIPISYVKLTFYIIILSFTMFHIIMKLTLITLFIGIDKYSPPFKFSIKKTTSIDWTIWQLNFLTWNMSGRGIIISFKILSKICFSIHVEIFLNIFSDIQNIIQLWIRLLSIYNIK